jgi:hypothetical protein
MNPADFAPVAVARPPLTGLDRIPLPAGRHPVAVYLTSHAPGSCHALLG